MTFYEENRGYKAWFEYAEPGLLTNRTIRNFLSEYRSETWPDVVKLTLLYGIVSLKKTHASTGDHVSIEKLRHLVRQLEAASCIEQQLPPIQEKMKDLKEDVREILEVFDTSTTSKSNKNAITPFQQKLKKDIEPAGIYPDWWGDGSEVKQPVQRRIQKPVRAAPRLCYSVPMNVESKIDDDDVVEPKYAMRPIEATAEHVAQPTVTRIADSFLTNRWTSALCQESYTLSTAPSSETTIIDNTVAPNAMTSSIPCTIPRPKSASFWVDLSQQPEEKTPCSERRRSRSGCVLDFGHLDSPRFPPKPPTSYGSTTIVDDIRDLDDSPFSEDALASV